MNVLKWVGSKRESINTIIDTINTSGTQHRRVFDCMAGSACFALTYNHPNTIVNDINSDVINLFHVLADKELYQEFVTHLNKLKNEKEFYYETRALFNSLPKIADVNTQASSLHAALFYYLVSFGFRGLSRYNKKGEINTAYGNVKSNVQRYYIDHRAGLETAGEFFANQVVVQGDVFDLLDSYEIGAGDLVYLDPPYLDTVQPYVKTFNKQDVFALFKRAKQLAEAGADVVVSYADDPMTYLKNAGFEVKELVTSNILANNLRKESLTYYLH